MREVIDNLLDHFSRVILSFGRRSQPVLRKVVDDLRSHSRDLRIHSQDVRIRSEHLRKAVDDLRIRSKDVRWSVRAGRLGRSPDAIIVVPLLGAALILGVLAATAATRQSSDGAGSDQVPAANRQVAVTGGASSGEVVTQTIRRKGKTVRVVRYRKKPGHVVLETISGRAVTLPGNSITLPPVTVSHMRTQTVTDVVTKTEVSTVTEIQPPVTVTVVETVTESQPSP
jgi:hypothetical protein